MSPRFSMCAHSLEGGWVSLQGRKTKTGSLRRAVGVIMFETWLLFSFSYPEWFGEWTW